MRYSSKLCKEQPGLTMSAERLYISMYRWLHTTRRSLPSNMHKPCDILLIATRILRLSRRSFQASKAAVAVMARTAASTAKEKETVGSGATLTHVPTGKTK
jgi:hypothetical protein